MPLKYEKYLRVNKVPNMWCPGCGIGIILKAMLRSIETLEWDKNEIAMISGIGCTSRTPGYVDANTLHTTHGRALTFATGIKMARPDKHVVVISGDGDSSAIGGNHLIHSCRRNIDMTLIIVNNNIYGMTGGQFSPTTPIGSRAATAPWGSIDPPFDLGMLCKAAGATYVARGHVGAAAPLERLIRGGMKHKGFSVIEVMSNCHTQFGRRNRLSDPVQLIDHIAAKTINVREAAKLSPEELKEKIIVGLLHEEQREEYCDAYARVIAKASASIIN